MLDPNNTAMYIIYIHWWKQCLHISFSAFWLVSHFQSPSTCEIPGCFILSVKKIVPSSMNSSDGDDLLSYLQLKLPDLFQIHSAMFSAVQKVLYVQFTWKKALSGQKLSVSEKMPKLFMGNSSATFGCLPTLAMPLCYSMFQKSQMLYIYICYQYSK